MIDRACQALHLLGLNPIAEAKADPYSYGFRTCRRAADAMEFIHGRMSQSRSPEWVLEGDIKACFDEIDHTWLEENIPMDKKTLKGWLKAGFMKGKAIFPTKSGTPQGGIISPVLANMALDGLQEKLRNTFGVPGKKEAAKTKVYLCRYADDFIISGATKELLENEVKPLVEQFLSERGLKLS
jgi:RNA-directed DNA polymerase